MKYQFIEEHRNEYPVTLMCRILEVARRGYYQWRKQPLSTRKMANFLLLMHIQAVFAESRDTYGSYRIQTELAEQGIRCGRKRVARLMQAYQMRPKTVRRFGSLRLTATTNYPSRLIGSIKNLQLTDRIKSG